MGIEHRKQRHSDADAARRGQNTAGHFRRLRVRRTIGRVMEVVELGDGGEASLQHLDIGCAATASTSSGDIIEREAIHGLAPRPELVVPVAPDFGKSGHCALEGVAVQIRRPRAHDRVTLVPFLRLAPISTAVIAPPSIVTRTSDFQPSGVSALAA